MLPRMHNNPRVHPFQSDNLSGSSYKNPQVTKDGIHVAAVVMTFFTDNIFRAIQTGGNNEPLTVHQS